MKTTMDWIERVLRWIMTVLFALLLVPVMLQILARYLPFVPRYIWTEEVARFCFIWVIMVGAMIAVRHGTHFHVDLLPQPNSNISEGLSRLVVHVVMFVFSLCFIWYGIEFAKEGSIQTSEIAELPMLSIYIAWPLAGAVWTLFLIEKLVEDFAIMTGRQPVLTEGN